MPNNGVRGMMFKNDIKMGVALDMYHAAAVSFYIAGENEAAIDMKKWQQKMRGHEDIAEMIMTEYFISGLGEYDEENYYDGY